MENVIIKKPRKKLFENRTWGERIVFILAFLLFAAVAAFYIYIFVWAVLAGLKTSDEVALDPFTLPQQWLFKNYIEIFSYMKVKNHTYFGLLLNSMYFSLLGPFVTMSVTSICAYTCSKYRFPFSWIFYPLVMAMITLPLFGNSGSMYLVLKRLGLIDSYAHLVLGLAGLNTNFLYFFATYESVSDSYGEAAIIDGANDFQVYFRVMFPQAINLFLALYIMAWVASWNDYAGVLLYLPNIPTLSAGIYMIEKDATYDVRFDMLYAAYVVAAIPPLVIFALFNNVLTHSVSVGGIKE